MNIARGIKKAFYSSINYNFHELRSVSISIDGINERKYTNKNSFFHLSNFSSS